jgi:hypothetical protein
MPPAGGWLPWGPVLGIDEGPNSPDDSSSLRDLEIPRHGFNS